MRLVDFVCGFGLDLSSSCGVLTECSVCAHTSVILAMRLVDFVCGFGLDLCSACGCVLIGSSKCSVCVCPHVSHTCREAS